MNLVALVGNLATDPEVRHTGDGRAICTFRLAVSRANDSNEADFFTVVAWQRQAEVCAEYLSVGRRVAVDGRLHHSTWEVEAQDGTKQRRSKVEVVAHRVEMLGGARKDRERERAAEATEAEASLASADAVPTPEFAL